MPRNVEPIFFAKLDPQTNDVVQIMRMNRNRYTPQRNAVEITEAQFLQLNLEMQDKEFNVASDGTLTERPRNIPYDQRRKRDYPEIGEQLDAIWKHIGPVVQPGSDAHRVFQKITKVKGDYPKPDNSAIDDAGSVVRGRD